MCKTVVNAIIVCLLLQGLCMAQSLVPIDPATVIDGHVYLLEDETDSSPNGHTGTIVGAPQVVDGLSGKAMEFNGTSDAITLPNIATINLSTHQNHTIIAVFKCADVSKPEKQVVYEEGGTTRGVTIYVHEGLVYAGGWNPADYTPQWPGTYFSAEIGSNEWHVVAAVLRDGGAGLEDDKFEVWMDGVLIGKGPGAELRSRSNACAIGYHQGQIKFHDGNNSTTGHYFEGIIDEVWIINEALTEDQLSGLGLDPALAKDPAPENESVDALRDGILSWTPGEFAQTHDVYFGTVFNDVNEASRDSTLDALASQGQTEAGYDPGRLEFGQTYFWRVDEVNGAPDRTIFKGETWSFEVEPFSVPVTNIQVTASSTHSADMGPENTINGSGLDALDQHSSEPTAMWLSGMVDPAPNLTYEFDKAYKLHEMLVWNSNQAVENFVGLGAKDVVIETSTDGETWVQLEGVAPFAQATGQANYSANTTVDFAGTVAKYVKLTISAGFGMIPQYGLSEVRFLSIPTNARELQPTDGATTSTADVALNWRAGREAASHEVYLGTDPNSLALTATTQENSYQTTGLDYATSYYWQIVEVNDAEDPTSHAGDVLSFSTPAFGTVDNFNQYDDDCMRIFFAWEDGLGHNGGEDVDDCDVAPSNGNGGGSVVGNASSPFAERSIVRTGQSMPLEYDNSFGPSEATLRLGSQDWTAGGVQTLSLFFYGDPANTGQLYLKINNTKVAYDGLADALQRTQWLAWNIDLASVGGNLQSVTSISIGVDGATASGMLYIDDIRLYPLAPETVEPVVPDPGDPNQVGYFEFEGNANDTMGNYSGTVSGGVSGPVYVAGKQGQAISLDEIDDQSVFLLPQAEVWPAYSVSLWAKTELFAQDNNSSLFSVSINTTSGFQVNLDGTDPGNYIYHGSVDGTMGPATSSWTHLGVTCDGIQTKLYYNGVLSTVLNVTDTTFTKIAVGVNRAEDNWFGGEIDELKLYDRALTSGEMAGLAELTQPYDKPFAD